MTTRSIVLFFKPPFPGKVKTRLAADIGAHRAASLYRGLLFDINNELLRTGIRIAPYSASDGPVSPQDLPFSHWRYQHGANLGERMAHALHGELENGNEQVVLIGSDIPDLTSSYIDRAFVLLDSHDMVLGPTHDGGYCLIGFSRHSFTPACFDHIPWSTGKVLSETRRRARSLGIDIIELSERRDLDTLDDLDYFKAVPCLKRTNPLFYAALHRT